MTTIHEALTALAPVAFTDVPTSPERLAPYLHAHFAAAQLLVESIPLVATDARLVQAAAQYAGETSVKKKPDHHETSTEKTNSTKARDSEFKNLFLSSDNVDSSAWKADWGAPLKISNKDNPLGVHIYKLASKDGRGSWFAQRSVHVLGAAATEAAKIQQVDSGAKADELSRRKAQKLEQLTFERWRQAFRDEIRQSINVKGEPGAGKVRGIAAERTLGCTSVDDVGSAEVFDLSASFPGLSAARQFVVLSLSTEHAWSGSDPPPHILAISKPCTHDEAPLPKGWVHAEYESVESMRRLQLRRRDLLSQTTVASSDPTAETNVSEGASQTNGANAQSTDSSGDDDETIEAVEWLMITRSDPGGSVPRFLVERGTPSGITSDTLKFVDWAVTWKAENISTRPSIPQSTQQALNEDDRPSQATSAASEATPGNDSHKATAPNDSTLLGDVVNATRAYTPQIILDHLAAPEPLHSSRPHSSSTISSHRTASISSSSSSDSFASAESNASHPSLLQSSRSNAEDGAKHERTKGTDSQPSQTAFERAAARLAEREAALDAELARARTHTEQAESASSERRQARIRKAEAKYARARAKAEAAHKKAIQDIAKKEKQEQERRRKHEAKAEQKRQKEQAKREREDIKLQLDSVRRDCDELRAHKQSLEQDKEQLLRLLTDLPGGSDVLQRWRQQHPDRPAQSQSSSKG